LFISVAAYNTDEKSLMCWVTRMILFENRSEKNVPIKN